MCWADVNVAAATAGSFYIFRSVLVLFCCRWRCVFAIVIAVAVDVMIVVVIVVCVFFFLVWLASWLAGWLLTLVRGLAGWLVWWVWRCLCTLSENSYKMFIEVNRTSSGWWTLIRFNISLLLYFINLHHHRHHRRHCYITISTNNRQKNIKYCGGKKHKVERHISSCSAASVKLTSSSRASVRTRVFVGCMLHMCVCVWVYTRTVVSVCRTVYMCVLKINGSFSYC